MPKLMFNLLGYLRKQNKSFFVLLGILFSILVCIIDYVTLDFFIFEFYLIPIVIAVWFAGRNIGIFIAFVAAISEIIIDIILTPYHSSHWVHYWNFFLNLSFFIVVVYILVFLKKTLTKLENLSETERIINKQLHAAIEDCKRVEESLREMNSQKSVFVANVSHELRNPLVTIIESLTLVIEGLSGEINVEQKRILETAKNNIERLIRLTTNLLDISKIEAGKMELKQEKIEIGLLIDAVVASYNIEISKKQITLKIDIPEDIGLFWADKDKITQVIINLLSNAVKYTPSGGNITIRLLGTDKEIRFEISDTGAGIAKGDIDKLFNKFERIFAEKQEGTGLGLSIAKDIVKLHNGKIWVESEIGKGSKFIFILPRNFRK